MTPMDSGRESHARPQMDYLTLTPTRRRRDAGEGEPMIAYAPSARSGYAPAIPFDDHPVAPLPFIDQLLANYRPAMRPAIEQSIEALIAFLDALDGDADSEPSLGAAIGNYLSQEKWAWSGRDDREVDAGDCREIESCH